MDGWREAAEATHGESYILLPLPPLSFSLFPSFRARRRLLCNFRTNEIANVSLFSIGSIGFVGNCALNESFWNVHLDRFITVVPTDRKFYCRLGRFSGLLRCLLGHQYIRIFPSVYNFLLLLWSIYALNLNRYWYIYNCRCLLRFIYIYINKKKIIINSYNLQLIILRNGKDKNYQLLADYYNIIAV